MAGHAHRETVSEVVSATTCERVLVVSVPSVSERSIATATVAAANLHLALTLAASSAIGSIFGSLTKPNFTSMAAKRLFSLGAGC